jgi:hypothetical protein
MTAPTTPSEAILQNALGPASASIDGRGSVTAKDIDQLIKADQYLAAKTAAANRVTGFGLRFQQIVPPGAG